MVYPTVFAQDCLGDVLISMHASPEIRSVLCVDVKNARILAAEITAVCDKLDAKQQQSEAV